MSVSPNNENKKLNGDGPKQEPNQMKHVDDVKTEPLSDKKRKRSQSFSSSPEPPNPKLERKENLSDHAMDKFDPSEAPCRDIHSVYKRVDYIDHGVYGSVHQGKNLKTGEIVALKKVKIKSGHRNGFPLTALRENNLLLNLKHPNIVDVKEVVFDDYDNGIFMVMEYMEHDLKRVMNTFMNHPFSIPEIKCLMQQLLQGIAYMHEHWVIHRDLKTSNLLYDNMGRLKICDFGMARTYGEPLGEYSPNVITLWYRAPELLLGAKRYGPEVDLWSAGAIMAELLFKKGLFEGNGELDQIKKIVKVLGTPNIATWPGLKDLPHASVVAGKTKPALRQLIALNGRSALSEMGLTLLKGLLNYNPRRRLTAAKALQHPWFNEAPPPLSIGMMPTFPSRTEAKKRQKHKNLVMNIQYSYTKSIPDLK